jgi:hypothetical protein
MAGAVQASQNANKFGKKGYDLASQSFVQFRFAILGAASPQAVKKLLSLSEQSKTRPKQLISANSTNSSSPLVARKPEKIPVLPGAIPRVGSSPAGPVVVSNHSPVSQSSHDSSCSAVDLTAESSSVTSSLHPVPPRKTSTNNG